MTDIKTIQSTQYITEKDMAHNYNEKEAKYSLLMLVCTESQVRFFFILYIRVSAIEKWNANCHDNINVSFGINKILI